MFFRSIWDFCQIHKKAKFKKDAYKEEDIVVDIMNSNFSPYKNNPRYNRYMMIYHKYVSKHKIKYLEYMKMCADAGDVECMVKFAGLLRSKINNQYGTGKKQMYMANVDKKNWKVYYKMAAARGNCRASNIMGTYYMVKQDHAKKKKAKIYYEFGYYNGDGVSALNLGIWHKKVKKNIVKAEYYFKKSIEMGTSQALLNLAKLYAKTTKNYDEAMVCFGKAASCNVKIPIELLRYVFKHAKNAFKTDILCNSVIDLDPSMIDDVPVDKRTDKLLVSVFDNKYFKYPILDYLHIVTHIIYDYFEKKHTLSITI
jgi:hypothetical protein